MDDSQDLLADALAACLAAQCTPAVVRLTEVEATTGTADADAHGDLASAAPPSPAGPGPVARALWAQIDALGFADALVPEAQGGAGLGLREVFGMLLTAGGHTLPLPLADTLLARALLAEAGIPRLRGAIALAEVTVGTDGQVQASTVRMGRCAEQVLACTATEARLLPTAAAQAKSAGFVLDARMNWPADAWAAAPVLHQSVDVRLWQACTTAALMAGSMLAVFQRTLQYANDRVQFGRPIGKFQAIQHQLSVLAEEAFAARMAAQIGCQAAGRSPDLVRVAVAKARTGEAAVQVAALAHSIHGAIGFTAEFDLQLHTRRLHTGRQTAGAEGYWQDRLGEALAAHPGLLTLDLLRQASDPIAPAA